MEKYVLDFKEVDKTLLSYVGGKGANLGEMTKAGFSIPQGFCITTLAYKTFIKNSKEMNKFFNLIDNVKLDDLKEINKIAKEIREHILSIYIPEDIKTSILQAFKQSGKNKAYAVRSSATAEDLPTASFAGQQDTYLNVIGEKQLLEAIKKCWASLFTDRAIIYRSRNGFDHRLVFLSVVVQEMIFPEVSGIMFTADPISGKRSTVSIDASFGLGEALVSGIVSADLYQVNNDKIIEKKISIKKIGVYSVKEGGTITKGLPDDIQKKQALSDDKIIELSKIGKLIEKHYGTEQDVEWCLVENKFYIVQSRPITSLYPVPKVSDDKLHILFSFGHQQMMTEALSPLAISIWRTILPFGKIGDISSENPLMFEVGGRLFTDLRKLLQVKKAREIVPKVLSGIDESISNGLKEVVKRPEFKDAKNKAVKKKVIKIIMPIGVKVLNNVFFKNPYEAINKSNFIMESFIKKSELYINKNTGSERIKRIQENCGELMLPLIKNVAIYPASGIISIKLIEHFTNKWLKNPMDVHVLNKSLPGNVTSELGLRIGDLADIVRQYPEIAECLGNLQDETFYQELNRKDKNGLFSKELDQFMKKYGMRCAGEIDIMNRRWEETPSSIASAIVNHINNLEKGQHRERFQNGLDEADRKAEEIIDSLRKTHGGFFKAKIMSRLIRVYRNVMGIRELPKYILVNHFNIYKKAILEEGENLVSKGILKDKSDVFFSSIEELRRLLEGDFDKDINAIIIERKNNYEQYKKLTPPRLMTSEGEIVRGRINNENAPKGALIGTPVSAGSIEGYARIVLKPEKAKLNKGEILIAPFTDPGWTPLFNSAKGLVMEVGGMMTHGAVVAREYGIPAVVGIDKATEIIKDGDYIRLDGTLGYVEILKVHKDE